MKKLLLALMFFGALTYLYFYLTTPRATPVYLSPLDQISQQEKPTPVHEIYGIINKINEKNANFKNISITNMPICLQQGNMTTRLTGELAMQKDKRFRLKVSHRLTGKEMDIGSNDEYFWFWSKRMEPPYLNYSRHENLNRTNLRTALNPSWLMESMNIGEISSENIEIAKFKEFWAVIQPRTGICGEKVSIMTLIDPKQYIVVGRYLYKSNKLIASTEYQNFSNGIAKKILIIWYEESLTLEWDLSCAKINTDIDPQMWVMPAMKNKVDIGK